MTDAPITPEPVNPTPAPAPAPAGNPDTFPGKTLGIVGLIVAFFASLIGAILSGIALKQSKDAGYKNTPAKVGLILGIIFFVIGLITFIALIALGAFAASGGANDLLCQGQAPGVYETTTGETVTCP